MENSDVLQIPVTGMSRQVLLLRTAYLGEGTFVFKDYETLQKMDPDSDGIHSNSTLTEYQKIPKYLEKYCLADFASLQRLVYHTHVTLQD